MKDDRKLPPILVVPASALSTQGGGQSQLSVKGE